MMSLNISVGMSWLFTGGLLACGLLSQFTPPQPAPEFPATRVAALNRNHQLATSAYDNLAELPGYRLTRQHIIIDPTGHRTTVQATETHDKNNNTYTTTQIDEQPAQEIYSVAGQQFTFSAQYQAWVDIERLPATDKPVSPATSWGIIENPAQLLAQFGAIPTNPSPDTLHDMAVTRYQIEPIVNEVAEALAQEQADLPIVLSGFMWVSDQTGALLKSEIILTDSQSGQVIQEHYLDISEIGLIETIEAPEPIVDPIAIVSATATAQVWTVLVGQMDYRGTPLAFELIPLAVQQVPDTSPLSSEVEMVVRELPNHIRNENDVDPFLSQLRQQLTLSIPNRNLIVTSSGYEVSSRELEAGILHVKFAFNADLEDFQRVELILSGPGNPQFAPVPVE